MKPERWQQIDELFLAALEHDSGERMAFVAQACADDESLRGEVESLIASHEQADSFIDHPAFEAAAELLADDQAQLAGGQRIGHYEILSLLGSGGMGEVYLAHDSRLDRKIALKLLPAYFTTDAERLRRFEQEAHSASALNHPNILTIHEIGQCDELHFMATEYIDGGTLRQHMQSTCMKLDEVLDVAVQVASALKISHEAGIVHRDIKPENIMLRRDGYVKILDFGIAKLIEQRAVEPAASTGARVKTDTGVVMGTSSYMSPEQVRGLTVDARTDIWSLGVVLYEMAAGRVPFEGTTTSDVIVSILEREPPSLTQFSPVAPTELQRIITKALRKDREERYQVIGDLLVDLKNLKQDVEFEAKRGYSRQSQSSEGGEETNSEVAPATHARPWWRANSLIVLLAGAALLINGLAWLHFSRLASAPLPPPMKVVPFTSFPGEEYLGTFSPDGNQIAFGWNGGKGENLQDSSIYVKQIGAEKPLRLTFDPANDFGPVWSPDGQRIVFNRFTQTECAIFIVPALGGAERKLLTLGPNPGWPGLPTLAWSPDGRFIAFTYREPKEEPYKIFLVSPDTLARHTLTSPSAENLGDFNPAFSPDGQSVAFVRQSSRESADIYSIPTSGGEPRRLTFDNVLLNGLAWTADGREIIFSSSRTGGFSSLWRIPASGGSAERVEIGGSNFYFPNISRQGNRLTYVQALADFNIYGIEVPDSGAPNNPPMKLITSTRDEWAPQFSPDGRRIAFQSDRTGQSEIWVCDSDGSNPVQVTTFNKPAAGPRWSPDGRQIAFGFSDKGRGDIYAISIEGGLPRPIATGDSDDIMPSWSRDGEWIYFASDRTGDQQVWKAPTQGGEAVQVTRQGGQLAFESLDGKYVYYAKSFPVLGIWRVPVDGGEELRVLDSFRSENYDDWAVVNDGLYFINPDPKDGVAIEFFDFATRTVRQVAGLGKAYIGSQSISVSPDRRQILYTQADQVGGDIMLVENFH